MTGDEFREVRRKSIKYSQARLSREMDITIRTITRWETGEVPIPKIAEMTLRFIELKARKKGKR